MPEIPENLDGPVVLEHETHFLNKSMEGERFRVILPEAAFITQWHPTAELALKEASEIMKKQAA
jgi:hypothetical protein